MADNNTRNAGGGYVTPFTSSEAFSMANFNSRIEEINDGIDALTRNGVKFAAGSYNGNGGTSASTTAAMQTISLGFAPKAVFVYPAIYTPYTNTGSYGYHNVYAALAVQGHRATIGDLTALELTGTGFTVNFQSKTVPIGSYASEDRPATNYGGAVFYYIALG